MELDGCIQIFALLFIGHVTFNRSLNFSVPHFPNPNFPMIPTSSGCGKDNLLCNVELLAQCLVLSKHSKDVIYLLLFSLSTVEVNSLCRLRDLNYSPCFNDPNCPLCFAVAIAPLLCCNRLNGLVWGSKTLWRGSEERWPRLFQRESLRGPGTAGK